MARKSPARVRQWRPANTFSTAVSCGKSRMFWKGSDAERNDPVRPQAGDGTPLTGWSLGPPRGCR